jgi:hypothetical protein
MKPDGGEVGLCVCGTGLLRVHGSLIVVDHNLANHYDGNYSLDLKKKNLLTYNRLDSVYFPYILCTLCRIREREGV